MKFYAHIPHAPLNRFVDRLWACSDTPDHALERILPSGTIELVVNLVDDEIRIATASAPGKYARYPGAVVSGTYSRSFLIDAKQHASIVGVHFKPGGAYPFLGAPASDLLDTHVELDAIWGSAARELREQLCEATSVSSRFDILERALAARLCQLPGRQAAITAALYKFEDLDSAMTAGQIAQWLQLSSRHFIDLFSARVGLTPKRYARIRRFQRVLDATRHQGVEDWAGLAAQHGYYDQSHLIRDFRQFSGLSPAQYQSRQSDNVLANHVPHSD